MTSYFDLMIAPTGAHLTKVDHPGLPVTASEIAGSVCACALAGATSAHLHARDHAGLHSLDPQDYAPVIDAVRAVTDIPLQISTEAAGVFDVAAQRTCLDSVTTGMASVALREMSRAPDLLADIYCDAADAGTEIQHILYDADDLEQLLRHMGDGVIPTKPCRAIFVLGRYSAGQVSHPSDLRPFLNRLGNTPLRWSVCAFGIAEQDCLLAALNEGGDVRIGFENNRLAPDGTPFADNAASVAAFVKTAAASGFTPGQDPS